MHLDQLIEGIELVLTSRMVTTVQLDVGVDTFTIVNQGIWKLGPNVK